MSSRGCGEGEHARKERALAFFIFMTLLASLFSVLLVDQSRTTPFVDTTAPARTLAGPSENGTLILHLHYNNVSGDYLDLMNTLPPYPAGVIDYDTSDAGWGYTLKRQPPKNYDNFIMSARLAAPLHIFGTGNFTFWASVATNNTNMDLDAFLYDSADMTYGGDTLISSGSLALSFVTEWTQYSISLPGINYTVPADHTLILRLVRNNVGGNVNLYVLFDQNFADSTLSLSITRQISITDSSSYGADGVPRTEFGDQEIIWGFANVSDAMGIYDIFNVHIVVNDLSDNSTVFSEDMPINSTDASAVPLWRTFRSDMGPFAVGNYSINITVTDRSNNTDWVQWTFSIVKVDHFIVSSSDIAVSAGESFDVTFEAIDSTGNRMMNWSGTLSIVAVDNATGLPISGLKTSSVFMPSACKGILTIDENFTKAPVAIRIRATNGSAIGLSQLITVSPAAMKAITVTPSSVSMTAGATLVLTANATDRFGNQNSSWVPYWQLNPANGTLAPTGYSVQLHALKAGLAVLMCQDNASGLNFTVNVNITISGLSRIIVTPDNDTIWEGRSTGIHAVGYDAFDNVVGIPTAMWSSDGYAMSLLTGSGQTGTLVGGMAPESGTVKVAVGSIVGKANISVITPPFGPTFGSLGNQVLLEDTPKVIALNWQDVNGTAGLSWFVTGVNDSLLIISHNASSPNLVDIIPQPNANGVNYVTFWVRDPTGYTNNRQISITVLPVNDPPVWINDPPKTIYVKFGLPYTFNYSYYIEDIDSTPDQLTLAPDPSNYISSSGLNLTYTFPDLYGGQSYYRIVKLVISDGLSSDDVTVTVWATSDTPPDLIKPLPDITIDEGQMNYFAFDLDDYFTDSDGDILYYSKGFENVEITINETSHEVYISSPSEWSGQTTAVFIAKDPTGALRTDTIVITVRPVNDPPQIAAIDPVHVHYGVEYSLDLRMYISDPDNGFEELTIVTSDPANATYGTIPYPHLTILYPANLSSGSYTGPYTVSLLLHVTDGGGLSTQKTFLVIVSDNYPPILKTDPPEFISFQEDTKLEKPYSLNLSALFWDADSDQLTFTFYDNENVIISLSPDGWVNFSAVKDWNGNENVVFKATDTGGAWTSFRINVVVIPVNDPPVLDEVGDIDHYGGRQWSMDIMQYIHDVDDPDLSNIEVLVISPSFVRAVGMVLYFEFPDGTDSTQVTIYVTDGVANSNYVTFKVEIKKTIEEMIGYPWSLIIVILLAGIAGYFLAFRVFPHKLEELFLIHNDGRLIYHEGKSSENGMDQDVVSAMFTAVQEFIRDSFKEQSGGGLKMLELGDRKILIEKGNWVYAAMIYSGLPPKSVFKNLTYFVRDIEGGYGSSIEHWDGTLKSLPGIQGMSRKMMLKKYHSNHENFDHHVRFEDMKAEKPSENEKKP